MEGVNRGLCNYEYFYLLGTPLYLLTCATAGCVEINGLLILAMGQLLTRHGSLEVDKDKKNRWTQEKFKVEKTVDCSQFIVQKEKKKDNTSKWFLSHFCN